MIKSIGIVTFISGKEKLNSHIIKLYDIIKKSTEQCELLIYTDHSVMNKSVHMDDNIKEFSGFPATKYQRIRSALKDSRCDYVLFVDNDIVPDSIMIRRLIYESSENIDLCFGKITVSQTQTIAEHLVKIDKTFSHNIIRPTLWNMNVGISVPGQIFLIRRKRFARILKQYDTLFDDLAIGICAKENGLNVFRSKAILGKEKPSADFRTLIRQRVRWAKGYSEMLKYNRKSRCYCYIVIHGIAYHASLALIDFLILSFFRNSPAISIVLLLFMLIRLSNNEIHDFPYVVLYMLLFPVIHGIWLGTLIKNLI